MDLSIHGRSNNESDNVNNDKSGNINDNKSDNINDDKYENINNDKSDDTNDDKSNNVASDESNKINDDKSDSTNNPREVCDPREAVRRNFYKNRIKKDNFKLDIDDSTPQEERRRLLLEYQKKYRDETVNVARGILQEYSFSTSGNEYTNKEEYMDEEGTEGHMNEEGYMDEEEYINEEEYIDEEECTDEKQYMDKGYMDIVDYIEAEENYVERYASWHYRILPDETKTKRMMLSEWMLDVPEDFTENWTMIPCPVGKRVRLISGWGETRAYSRKGVIHCIFPSALPGGHRKSDFHHSAAIDCIWVQSRKIFIILDVLYWSLLPFTNCPTEVRQFWFKNKFYEIPEFQERDTNINKFPILLPQIINCNRNLSSVLNDLDEELPLDGFLFYHREAIYTYGVTPLVTWLKPFMLPEVLGISVPPPFDEKPIDYINFEHHVEKIKSKKNQDITKVDTNIMEIEEVV